MPKRYVSIWLPCLETDWFSLRRPSLKTIPFVLASPDHGRMMIRKANPLAQGIGINDGMVLADARTLHPSLLVLDHKPLLAGKLLKGIAEWCIRYTPTVAIDAPDGLILDATGCTHLWKGDRNYLTDIITRLKGLGYLAKAAMADTIGAAWAVARFGPGDSVIEKGQHSAAFFPLPPAALRIDLEIVIRLEKLGLHRISDLIGMPRASLRRRFGTELLKKLDQALGNDEEIIQPVCPVIPYQERLVCGEPIITRTAIEIALQQLLEIVCQRLGKEQKGLRRASLKSFRMDGKIEAIEISTNRPSANPSHLFKLFEYKIGNIEPGPGIELFLLEAPLAEDNPPLPASIWSINGGLDDTSLSELLDRLTGKFGKDHIHQYEPDEHYWPERSFKPVSSFNKKISSAWKTDRPRPLQLLASPEPIQVTAPIPDYPPMLFRHRGSLHKIIKADGPERIEQEWWIQQGQHRDYYSVEDEEGRRYWLFRLGHYTDKNYQWYLHGFFA